jgi:hypothetical protein
MVTALGNFKDDADVATRLRAIADQDTSYRARASALQAIGKLKAPNAFGNLESAISGDSPDDILRNAALRSLGNLGDDKAVPLLRTWSALGKPMESRQAAITSLGRMQKDNKDITKELSAYLLEPHFPVRMSALYALGAREDASAIPALESLLKSNDLSIAMAPIIKTQIARLKRSTKEKPDGHPGSGDEDDDQDESSEAGSGGNKGSAVADRLDKIEHLVQEMNDRLKSIETQLRPK